MSNKTKGKLVAIDGPVLMCEAREPKNCAYAMRDSVGNIRSPTRQEAGFAPVQNTVQPIPDPRDEERAATYDRKKATWEAGQAGVLARGVWDNKLLAFRDHRPEEIPTFDGHC